MGNEAGPAGFSRVCVLGLGVMGGSLAKALSNLDRPPRRTGWSPEAREGAQALRDGAVDRVAATPEEGVADADLVVLSTPLAACAELVPRVVGAMPPGALLTDVAGLKMPLHVAVARAGALERWVGSHPMCGSADSGYGASRSDLYRGASVWMVVPTEARAAAPSVAAFWEAVGAHPEIIDVARHDALMALTSHLPQLTANALASVMEEAGVASAALGPGGRDMTRLSASSPGMWRDLLACADPALAEALRLLATRSRELADLVEARDADALAAWMEKNRTWRRTP